MAAAPAVVATTVDDVDLQTPFDNDVDYDALYEEADDLEEDVDMKSHGSVITHLLSQVRIGMDLTKIVLPTFILERRSLLEMYSDFFAHPDIFLEICDGKDPEERMIRVLRWYLSSFHAGRKSTVAKKPYNPILVRTFVCNVLIGVGLEESVSLLSPRPLLFDNFFSHLFKNRIRRGYIKDRLLWFRLGRRFKIDGS